MGLLHSLHDLITLLLHQPEIPLPVLLVPLAKYYLGLHLLLQSLHPDRLLLQLDYRCEELLLLESQGFDVLLQPFGSFSQRFLLRLQLLALLLQLEGQRFFKLGCGFRIGDFLLPSEHASLYLPEETLPVSQLTLLFADFLLQLPLGCLYLSDLVLALTQAHAHLLQLPAQQHHCPLSPKKVLLQNVVEFSQLTRQLRVLMEREGRVHAEPLH
jgi:hypothetical protein